MAAFIVKGNVVDIMNRKIFNGEIFIKDGKIEEIKQMGDEDNTQPYITPGFIDSHIHIESSMLVPSAFAKIAVVHGTVATISDPHEIGNVNGVEGMNFMIEDGKTVPFKFHFGAPSCVPATVFETAGATINSKEVEELLSRKEIYYLSEMMNFPGVLNEDDEVMKKIAAAKKAGKPVDGHAPGLRGEAAKKYIEAGISTDHECFTAEEALDKLNHGMKILIREGSAAKNFEALIPLLDEHYNNMMFCSDDKHPDSLVEGHIDVLCKRAIEKGNDVFKVLQAACINPVLHYKMDVGLLKAGDDADFIVLEDLKHFKVLKTFINGQQVAENGKSFITTKPVNPVNNFNCSVIKEDDIKIEAEKFIVQAKGVPVIEALDGQLITNKLFFEPSQLSKDGFLIGNTGLDVLKIVVINRYKKAAPSVGFIKNFGFKRGAIASSVAHDSHNIIAVGATDEAIVKAVNLLVEKRGGVSCVDGEKWKVLSLPVAGLMSDEDGYQVAKDYTAIDKMAKELGSSLDAPFMTLSFMGLLVIPHLKMSDMGLFDGDDFSFIKNNTY